MRIKASLVYIESDGARIGTGAINIAFRGEIFTPKAEMVVESTRYLDSWLDDAYSEEILKIKVEKKHIPKVVIRSGIKESFVVSGPRDYDEIMIKLIVSINQQNLWML